ncbi:MFS transporter, partial [Bifidobacterium sp.]
MVKSDDAISAVGEMHIWNRSFISVCLANTLMSIALQICNVIIGKFTFSLGATAAIVGMVSGAFAWSSIVLKGISGPTIDALDRRYVVMAAMAVMGVAMVFYGVVGSVPELFAARFLQGAGQAFSTTCFIAMAADTLPREKMGTGLGFYALAAGIAQMVGPVVSLKVQAAYGYRPVFFIAALVMFAGILAASQIKLPPRVVKKFKLTFNNIIAKEALIPAFLMILLSGCYALVNPFLAIYSEQQGVGSNISFFFSVYAALLFLTRPLSGKLADRFGYAIIVPMLGIFIVSFWLISVSTQLWMFLLAAVFFAFGYGGCQPVLQSMAMKLVPQERRGAGSSTNFIGSDLGNIIGPIIGGYIAQTLGYQAMWQIMSVALVVGIVTMLFLQK